MPGTLPLCTKKPTPKDLPESIEFDPRVMYPGFLAVFLGGWQGKPCREILRSTPPSEVFLPDFYLF